MKTYQYKSPTENGYTRFRLTKQQHNTLFPKRKRKWMDRYEYFYNDKKVIIHKYINWKGILFVTLTLPLTILMHGVVHTKEIWRELRELYNQKGTGAYVSDFAYDETYQSIMDKIRS